MRAHIALLLLSLPIQVASPAAPQNAPGNAEPKPLEVTACEILKNPAAFNNKLVKVRGYVFINFEYSLLEDKGCSGAIWFALADDTGAPGLQATVTGTGKTGAKNSRGKRIPPITVKLLRDSNFEKLEHYLKVKAEVRTPCFDDPERPISPDCDVSRVTATFTGRIDSGYKAVHEGHLRKSPDEKPNFKGFGQMGLFDAQLVVGLVEDVRAVDSLGQVKP